MATKNDPVINISAKRTFKQMTFKEKISYVKTVITVEPLIAFYFMPSYICGSALYTLELEKACRVNGNFSEEICDKILKGENITENGEVQKIIANVHSWQNPLQNIVPIILILFLASYSDRHKIRKPFLLIPIVGEFFAIIGCILCVVFKLELPIEFQGLFQTVIPSFFGGSSTLIMAVFAYIADISTFEMRTLRIGIILIILTICSLLSALGGYLFTVTGYYTVLGIGGLMFLVAFLYGLVFIKEDRKRPKYESAKSFFRDIFDPLHAIDTLKLLFRRDSTVRYQQLYLVMAVYFVSGLVTFGEDAVFWLFALETYSFTPVDTSYFSSIKNSLVVIGSAIFLPLFTKVFKFHDATIIVITFLDKIASNILLIVFVNKIGLYIGTAVANCHSIANTALRSLMTKSVEVKDLAKALSLFSLCETIANAIAAIIYNGIYSLLVEDYPEGFLIVGVILFGICCVIITLLYKFNRKMFIQDGIEPSQQIKEDTKLEHIKQTPISQTTKL